jgi:Family of unknown function (DUF5947)
VSGIAALRRFARPAPSAERCDLCGVALPPVHEHLAEPAARRLVCACGACVLLFSAQEAGRFRRVPPRLERLTGLRFPEDRWSGLGVPVRLAFFHRSSAAGSVVAVYPSPAGPLEFPVDAAAWDALVTDNPVLGGLTSDVEALLVNRLNGSDDAFRCSLDRCYHLIGLVRNHWQGMTGGRELWQAVEGFFAGLLATAGDHRP